MPLTQLILAVLQMLLEQQACVTSEVAVETTVVSEVSDEPVPLALPVTVAVSTSK